MKSYISSMYKRVLSGRGLKLYIDCGERMVKGYLTHWHIEYYKDFAADRLLSFLYKYGVWK